jgi:16S rRNA (cytosine1402-N4)-methyltransferase
VSERLIHRTVLLEEAVAALAIKSNGVYVDATFGRGGHSRRILDSIGQAGQLYALDRDAEAIAAAQEIKDPRFCALHASFGQLQAALSAVGVLHVAGVLLDLGVSSPQIDDPSRGFSFRHNGPLDMRMDQGQEQSAADWLNNAGEQEIAKVIKDYGEERFAKQIARSIVAARGQRPLATTGELAALVAGAVKTRERGQDPATRTFQAVRIFLNRELEELALVLTQAMDLLDAGGRLAVISFHSLEDRIVKNFMRDLANPGDKMPSRLPLKARDLPQPTLTIIGKPVYASDSEVAANPRARSAVMRVAEKRVAA